MAVAAARSRCRGDAGEVASTVVLMPVVLFLIMAMVQAALTWHAKTLVDAAASDGLIAVQVDGGTEADGETAVAQLLNPSSQRLLSEVTVHASRSGESSTVNVEARVVNVIPLLPIRVHATATGPTERFRSEAEQP